MKEESRTKGVWCKWVELSFSVWFRKIFLLFSPINKVCIYKNQTWKLRVQWKTSFPFYTSYTIMLNLHKHKNLMIAEEDCLCQRKTWEHCTQDCISKSATLHMYVTYGVFGIYVIIGIVCLFECINRFSEIWNECLYLYSTDTLLF